MANARLTELEQDIERILLATDWREWEANEEAWELSVRVGIDPDTGLMLADTDSRTLPDLPNKPNKTNWVEKAGGLPSYIKRIAKHLHFEKAMDVSRAIAVAVNTVKRWCGSGAVTGGGGQATAEKAAGRGGGHVTAATKALACKAVAAWEAKRGAGKAAGVAASAKTRLVVFEGVYLSQEDADYIRELTDGDDGSNIEDVDFTGVDFDPVKYELALAQARADAEDAGELDLAEFREELHPRLHGKFIVKGDHVRSKLTGLNAVVIGPSPHKEGHVHIDYGDGTTDHVPIDGLVHVHPPESEAERLERRTSEAKTSIHVRTLKDGESKTLDHGTEVHRNPVGNYIVYGNNVGPDVEHAVQVATAAERVQKSRAERAARREPHGGAEDAQRERPPNLTPGAQAELERERAAARGGTLPTDVAPDLAGKMTHQHPAADRGLHDIGTPVKVTHNNGPGTNIVAEGEWQGYKQDSFGRRVAAVKLGDGSEFHLPADKGTLSIEPKHNAHQHYDALAGITHIQGKLPDGFKLKKVPDAERPDSYDMRRVESLHSVHAPDGTHLGYVGKHDYRGESVMSRDAGLHYEVGRTGAGKRWSAYTQKGKAIDSVGLSTRKNRMDALRSLGRYHPEYGKDRRAR